MYVRHKQGQPSPKGSRTGSPNTPCQLSSALTDPRADTRTWDCNGPGDTPMLDWCLHSHPHWKIRKYITCATRNDNLKNHLILKKQNKILAYDTLLKVINNIILNSCKLPELC